MAILKLLEYFNDGYTWIVDIDLQKLFDTVCYDKLIFIIMKTIHDGELVSLIRKYLVSGVMKRNSNTCKLIKRISFSFGNFRNMKL